MVYARQVVLGLGRLAAHRPDHGKAGSQLITFAGKCNALSVFGQLEHHPDSRLRLYAVSWQSVVMTKNPHRELTKRLTDNGYTVEVSGSGHLKVRRPNGSFLMTMSLSPSDVNATRKAAQLLRRLGVELS